MAYYPVTIQRLNESTEVWSDYKHLHAVQVNTWSGASPDESYNAGAGQYHPRITFVFRWSKALESIAYSPQIYRMCYRGHTYDIRGYDDYMEQHNTISVVGVAYG